ncbi:MAG: hypothetical protein AAGF30_06060 [Pseudomonadota bacterium]
MTLRNIDWKSASTVRNVCVCPRFDESLGYFQTGTRGPVKSRPIDRLLDDIMTCAVRQQKPDDASMTPSRGSENGRFSNGVSPIRIGTL